MPVDDEGFFQRRSDRRTMNCLAHELRERVTNLARVAGREDVALMLSTDLPGDAALQFYAAELGGSIMISQLYADPVTYPPMLYGQGPLV
eukprot:3774264-Karenia_brevis.AAC.1